MRKSLIKIILLIGAIFIAMLIYSNTYAQYIFEERMDIANVNIDKTPPVVSIEKSIEEETSENVVVKIHTNEPIKEIEGWSLNKQKNILSKEYAQNILETVEISDIYGNITNAVIEINNIDKVAPVVKLESSSVKLSEIDKSEETTTNVIEDLTKNIVVTNKDINEQNSKEDKVNEEKSDIQKYDIEMVLKISDENIYYINDIVNNISLLINNEEVNDYTIQSDQLDENRVVINILNITALGNLKLSINEGVFVDSVGNITGTIEVTTVLEGDLPSIEDNTKDNIEQDKSAGILPALV